MISIIVPIYNTAQYLDRCISSIVHQTYTDIEILLIDDGSTDDSSSIIDQWALRDSRIHVIHKEKNTGVSDSRNIGLTMSHGEFIGFVDSDDWIEPEMYSEIHHWIEFTNADAVFGGYNRITAEGIEHIIPPLPSGNTVSVDEALSYCIPQRGEGGYDMFLWDKLFRRSSIFPDGEIILFDQRFSYGEDILWFLHAILNCRLVTYWKGCGYNYYAARQGNTWSEINKYTDMIHCQSALETNQAMFQMLQKAQIGPINNAFQRVLFYRRFAFRTAANIGDKATYRKYHSGYYRDLLKWYRGNKTVTGLKWLIRQFEADWLFQINRIRKKRNKEFS